MKHLVRFLLVGLSIWGMSGGNGCTACAASGEAASLMIPITRGSRWSYEGTVRWTMLDSGVVRAQRITWPMEILEAFNRNGISAALLSGFPTDLAWYEAGQRPGTYLLLQLDRGDVYLLADANRIQTTLARLRDDTDPLHDLTHPSERFLELPLHRGKSFGCIGGTDRTDRSYCWIVEAENWVDLSSVRGLEAGLFKRYHLLFRSRPDDTAFDVVPGLGIIRYRYQHHGTIAEATVQLVEYHAGNG